MKKLIIILILLTVISPNTVFANKSYEENKPILEQEHRHKDECVQENKNNQGDEIFTLDSNMDLIQPYGYVIHACHVGNYHGTCWNIPNYSSCGCYTIIYWCCCGVNTAYHYHYCDSHWPRL